MAPPLSELATNTESNRLPIELNPKGWLLHQITNPFFRPPKLLSSTNKVVWSVWVQKQWNLLFSLLNVSLYRTISYWMKLFFLCVLLTTFCFPVCLMIFLSLVACGFYVSEAQECHCRFIRRLLLFAYGSELFGFRYSKVRRSNKCRRW